MDKFNNSWFRNGYASFNQHVATYSIGFCKQMLIYVTELEMEPNYVAGYKLALKDYMKWSGEESKNDVNVYKRADIGENF